MGVRTFLTVLLALSFGVQGSLCGLICTQAAQPFAASMAQMSQGGATMPCHQEPLQDAGSSSDEHDCFACDEASPALAASKTDTAQDTGLAVAISSTWVASEVPRRVRVTQLSLPNAHPPPRDLPLLKSSLLL